MRSGWRWGGGRGSCGDDWCGDGSSSSGCSGGVFKGARARLMWRAEMGFRLVGLMLLLVIVAIKFLAILGGLQMRDSEVENRHSSWSSRMSG